MSELHESMNLPVRKRTKARQGMNRPASLRVQMLREQALAYVFLAPSMLLFSIFMFYPMLKSVYLSLHSTSPTGQVAAFVGLENFVTLLRSGLFFQGIQVTVLFALLTVPVGILLALVLAALTHTKLKGMRIFQFSFALPMVLSVGSSAVIWKFLFHPTLGMLNYWLSLVGIEPIPWLTSPDWALFSIAMMTIWMNLGFNYIVLSSGLQGIPEELYESAKIDGAGAMVTFWRISLPLLSPTIFFVVVVSIIGAFQSFAQINILTKGGPMNSTNVFVYSIYQEAFVNFRFGTGSAQALVLFSVIFLLTLIQFKWVEKKVHYQ